MLQQILKDMYIDPDVLEALNEDQKKTLFLKMRQEQVRRWTEREEKVPADGRSSEGLAAKSANRKSVNWMLGRDGDVAVMVIGDSDEPRSGRLTGTSLEDRTSPYQHKATLKSNLVNKTTAAESGRTVGESPPPKPQTGIHLNLKGDVEEVSCSPPLQVSASDKPPPRAVDDPPETPRAREAAAPEESKPSVTFYRPHIRVAPAAQRHVNVSSPPPASVTTPAAPASASTPSLRSSAAAPASSSSLASAPASSSSLASAPASSSSLASAPALALARCSAPALALARASTPASTSASTPASTSASTPASTPTPAPTPPLALSPSAPTSSSTASKTPTPTPPSSRLHLQEPPEPPPQESQANRDIRVVAASRRLPPEEEAGPEGGVGGGVRGGSRRGRVAQLMKTFSANAPALAPPPRGSKPPLPSKPSHLRLTASPSLR